MDTLLVGYKFSWIAGWKYTYHLKVYYLSFPKSSSNWGKKAVSRSCCPWQLSRSILKKYVFIIVLDRKDTYTVEPRYISRIPLLRTPLGPETFSLSGGYPYTGAAT